MCRQRRRGRSLGENLVIFFILTLIVLAAEALHLKRLIRPHASQVSTAVGVGSQQQYETTSDCFMNRTSRRRVFQQLSSSMVLSRLLFPSVARADDEMRSLPTEDSVITVPLKFVPSLNAYVLQFFLFNERFGAIVDTGSPFLTVPSYCNTKAYGCYRPERTRNSGYSNTVESFDNNQGTVVWRKAAFSFDEKAQPTQNLVFGVLDESLMDGSGGVFLGLVKETDNWIRPSFLGQTGYQSFSVDLRRNNNVGPQLILSKQPMIGEEDEVNDYIPLVKDLNRRYKAPVVHYTVKAKSFVVNGLSLRLSEKQPTYVIFDTGVSGMVVSQELFDGRYLQARKNREKSLWGQVSVAFTTKAGKDVSLSATKPVTTPLGKATPWPRFNGNLIVLGLAFLDGREMTIDIDGGKLQFSD